MVGGYTKKDLSNIRNEQNKVDLKNKSTLIHLIMDVRNLYLFSKTLYGSSADDWCKRVYSEIENLHDRAIDMEFTE